MPVRATVKWFADKVHLVINKRAQTVIEDLAYEVRDNARKILEEDDHIDTRFLYNSIYVSTPNGSSPIHPSGTYTSTKGNGQVRRENGPIVNVSRGAFVGAAADYAIYVELQDSFIYRALEETRGAASKVLTGIYVE